MRDARATRLMFNWVESGTIIKPAHIDLLPWIRVAKDTPETVVVSRKGRLDGMGLGSAGEVEAEMAVDGEGEQAEEMEE